MPKVIKIDDAPEPISTKKYPYAKWKYPTLNVVQSRLLETYEGDSNITIAARTSAGKSICSEIYMAYEMRAKKKKAIYIAPLKALAQEKYDDWTDPNYHFNDLNVSICTGDYRITESRIKELDRANIIILTPEMLSSRCRNWKSEKSNFLKEVGCIVFDESHLLTVPGRGDHIEIALMKLTEMNPDARVVMLSATMPNVDEICGWVSNISGRDTYYLQSNYRPVPLGISYPTYYDGDKTYDAKENEKVSTAVGIVTHFSEDKFLVFAHTKRTGQLMIDSLKRYGIKSEFHNANLDKKKRVEIENKFKNDKDFRVVVATSGLAWGCNFPARRVIIMGIDRGLQPVEVYDITQMIGRSGRMGLDPRGDAYILVPESKKEEAIARLRANPPIKSQLLEEVGGHYKTLAFHVVSEIHHGNVTTQEGFRAWFKRSLAFHQTKALHVHIIDATINDLKQCKAITDKDGTYEVTSVGTVASMFYYSPFDVSHLKENFTKLFERGREKDDYAVAVALANIDSNRFGIVNKVEKLEMSRFANKIKEMYGEGAVLDPAVKVAFAYYNMLNGHEIPAFSALQQTLRQDSDRTLEVITAIDTMAGKWGKSDWIKVLRARLTYGVRPELVELVQIPNIGRVRAEKLFKAKIRSLDDFLAAGEEKISILAGVSKDKAKESVNAARNLKLVSMY